MSQLGTAGGGRWDLIALLKEAEVPVAWPIEHGVSKAKVIGLFPQERTI